MRTRILVTCALAIAIGAPLAGAQEKKGAAPAGATLVPSPMAAASPSITPFRSQATNIDDYKKHAAGHIVAQAKSELAPSLPPILKSVVVLDITVDAEGNVTRAVVWRSNGYQDLEQTALTSVKRVGKLPAPSPEVLKGQESVRFLETWLFRHDGRYHVRSVVPPTCRSTRSRTWRASSGPRSAAKSHPRPTRTARALPGRFALRAWKASARAPLIIGVPSIRPRIANPKRSARFDRPLHLADAERPQDPHHARGDRASLHGPPDRHPGGRPVQARVPEDQPEQQDARDRRPGRAGRQADVDVRVGRDPLLPRLEDREVPAGGRPRPVDGDAVGDVPDGPHRTDARPGAPLPRLRAGEDRVRDEPLPQRGEPALRRARPAAEGDALRRRQASTRSPTWRSCRGCARTSGRA